MCYKRCCSCLKNMELHGTDYEMKTEFYGRSTEEPSLSRVVGVGGILFSHRKTIPLLHDRVGTVAKITPISRAGRESIPSASITDSHRGD